MHSSRSEAKASDAMFYFTGKPCKSGHVSSRLASNGNCTECNLVYGQKWRDANPTPPDTRKGRVRDRSKVNTTMAVWRESNREGLRAASREWYAANPDKRRVKEQARRARARKAEGKFSLADVERITKGQNGLCACCGSSRKLTIDHIVPLSKGGSNWPSNIQMLCSPCNTRKKDRDPVEFMRSMEQQT